MIARYIAGVCLTLALLGCQSSGSAFGPPAPMQRWDSSSRRDSTPQEKILWSFDGPDGLYPPSGLTQRNGRGDAFYGTTARGGAADVGTVYRVTIAGAERVLLSFKAGRHSFSPTGALTPMGNKLYGTAAANYRCGSRRVRNCAGEVYSIDKSGKKRLVYAFKGGRDGAGPIGALTVLNGALYGVTSYGGRYGQGTVFEVSTSGTERVLVSFVKPDGLDPTGGLVNVNGTLYGTTTSGGTYAYGTVFSITPSGDEVVLHSFSGPPDGAFPASGLTELDGTLYGTTTAGGGGYCSLGGYLGCGTVFSIDTSGNETVVYEFNGYDGAGPQGGLTDVDGVLFGSTADGGEHRCGRNSECGTIFSVDTSGNATLVHDFSGPPDGAVPSGDLIYAHGTILGTTKNGGSDACGDYRGCGTVFSIALSKHRSNPNR